MSIPDKQIVLKTVGENMIAYYQMLKEANYVSRVSAGKKLILCTPSSKLHPQGQGWFDLTIKQVEILDDSDIAILAVRLEGNKIYYINFKELRELMTPDIMLENSREGKHWKFYVWGNYIKVQGNEKEFYIQPEVLV